MIDEALNQMDKIIMTKILTKPAFEHAIAIESQYVQDRDFRLKFLRANLFDTYKAALNFTRYLEVINKYFGPEALTRPLLFSDLGEPELDLVRCGHLQLLPTRDRSGRRVWNAFGLHKENKEGHAVRGKSMVRYTLCLLFCFRWMVCYDILIAAGRLISQISP